MAHVAGSLGHRTGSMSNWRKEHGAKNMFYEPQNLLYGAYNMLYWPFNLFYGK